MIKKIGAGGQHKCDRCRAVIYTFGRDYDDINPQEEYFEVQRVSYKFKDLEWKKKKSSPKLCAECKRKLKLFMNGKGEF